MVELGLEHTIGDFLRKMYQVSIVHLDKESMEAIADLSSRIISTAFIFLGGLDEYWKFALASLESFFITDRAEAERKNHQTLGRISIHGPKSLLNLLTSYLLKETSPKIKGCESINKFKSNVSISNGNALWTHVYRVLIHDQLMFELNSFDSQKSLGWFHNLFCRQRVVLLQQLCV